MIIPANPGSSLWLYDPFAKLGAEFLQKVGEIIAWDIPQDVAGDTTYAQPIPITDECGPSRGDRWAIRRPDGSWFTHNASFENEATLREFVVALANER